MTHFLRDILRQPTELRRTLEHLAGPGAPAFTFVRGDLRGELSQPIWGWWGRAGLSGPIPRT